MKETIMHRLLPRMRRLLILSVALVALLAAIAPATTARATSAPTWQAWGLTVDFPTLANDAPKIMYTVYVGTNDPTPQVIAESTPVDLWANGSCTIQGTGPLTWQGGYADFNGNAYIRCRLPSWRAGLAALAPGVPGANNNSLTCEAGGAPLFLAAQVKLDAVTSNNPIIDAAGLGVAFSAPSDGIKARTSLTLTSGTYSSPRWIQSSAGNSVVIGENGPAIVAVAAHFGWLDFLSDPNWDDFFNTVTGTTIGHWVESPSAHWTAPAARYKLKTQADLVYIGYSPATSTYLHGELGAFRADPGCKNS
jgi:hypothetical protein